MHSKDRQWKRILANPKILAVVSIGIFMFGYILMVFLNNILISSIYWLIDIKNYNFSNGAESVPSFLPKISLELFIRPRMLVGSFYPYHVLVLIIAFLFVIFLTVKRVYQMRISYRTINRGTKGTEQFTPVEELSKQFRTVKKDGKPYRGLSGVPVASLGDLIFIDDSNQNTEILGSTQSGKTQLFSYPLLDLIIRAEIKDSFVLFDLKGDMTKNTYEAFKKAGWDCYCYNLLDPDNSISINPLEIATELYFSGKEEEALMKVQEFAFNLYDNPKSSGDSKIWESGSMKLLSALILGVMYIAKKENKRQYVTLYTVLNMFNSLGKDPDENGNTALDYFFDQLPQGHPAQLEYGQIRKATGNTKTSYFTSMEDKLSMFANSKIARLTSTNSFDLKSMGYGDKPVALFIILPDNDVYYPLVATLLEQINGVLADEVTKSDQKTLPRRLRFIGEETGNMKSISNLSKMVNLNLEKGIMWHFILQNEAQFKEKYGDYGAKQIFGACAWRYYILSDDMDDAKTFTEMIGSETIISGDRSGDPLSLDKSYRETEDARKLLDDNEIRHLYEGEWIAIRTKKRKDLEGNHVKSYPIFANHAEGTAMQPAHEYLKDIFFSNKKPLASFNFAKERKDIPLENLIIQFETTEEESEIDELYKTYQHNHDEHNIENYLFEKTNLQEGGNRLMTAQIEGIPENQTDLTTLSIDKRNHIKILAKRQLNEEEFNEFNRLTTIEQVSEFLKHTPSRQQLFEKIKQYLD